MRLNHTLGELNENDFDRYGEWRYHVTVMGKPSATEPWGWQLVGHHAIVNYFVLGDQVIMTPLFAGSEPVTAHAGKFKGTSVLQDEQNRGVTLVNALDEAQRKKAILKVSKTGDENRTEAWKDNVVLDNAGLRVSEMSDAQRKQLLDLERFATFGLELHPEKTRLLEFGPYAAERRQRAGKGKPETFDFLGFTHICGKKRNGRFTVVRQTIRKRLQAKLHEVKAELRRRRHDLISQVGTWLGQVVGGHTRYYGVPMNGSAIALFRFRVGWLWHRALARRSHTGHVSWERMRRLVERWLPPARICHPYPLRRLGVVTGGRSRMR